MELLWVQCGAVFDDHRPPSRLLALGEVCVESKQAQRAAVVALPGLLANRFYDRYVKSVAVRQADALNVGADKIARLLGSVDGTGVEQFVVGKNHIACGQLYEHFARMGLVALCGWDMTKVQMRARHDAERTSLGRHILQVGEAVTGRGRGVGVRLEVCARRVVGPHIGVVKRIAVPLCYSIKLVGRPAREPGYFKTVELYKGAHDPLGKVEHVGIKQVWFE
mgnify:CR=1 FL=1